jgi:hypothetical protein
MWAAFTKWALRSVAGERALHRAARDGEVNEVATLLARGCYDVNTYYLGQTPLHFSMISQAYKCAICLLEKGKANVNLPLQKESPNDPSYEGNFIHKCLYIIALPNDSRITVFKQRKMTDIRLLTIYGITEDGVDLNANGYNQTLITCFRNMRELYRKKCQLEHLVEQGQPNRVYEAYQELARLWNDLATDETHPDVKEHYQQKALFYTAKAKKLESSSLADTVEKKTSVNTVPRARQASSSSPDCFPHPASIGLHSRSKTTSKIPDPSNTETVPLLARTAHPSSP